MKTDLKQRRLARKLVLLSMEDGLVSGEKVSEVLASLRQAPGVRDRITLLRLYRRLLAREIARHTAVIEASGDLAPAAIRQLEEALSRQYGRRIQATLQPNPALLAGLRVRVGDDVLDASLSGRLQRLATAVR